MILRAWSAKKSNKDFVRGNQVLLKRTDSLIVDATLHGQTVDLGDLELNAVAFSALRRKINSSRQNDPNFNYILFIPSIISDDRIQTGGNVQYKHVVYRIYGSASLNKDAFAATLITDANPSPPREAY